MSNKTMPYSIEAEESLLGNIMLYKDAMRETVDSGITVEDFYLEKHQSIYNLMSAMYERRESIDTVSLSQKLKDFGIYDKVGGIDYLIQLANATISATNTKEYINIIKNKSLARKVIKVGEEISMDAFDSSVSVDEMLENVEKKVTDVDDPFSINKMWLSVLKQGSELRYPVLVESKDKQVYALSANLISNAKGSKEYKKVILFGKATDRYAR